MNSWFNIVKLVTDNKACGMEQVTFRGLRPFNFMTLSEEALRILIIPNAGGNSIVSEVLSYEVMKKCFRAQLLKTEMEVKYFPHGGSITDYVARIYDTTVGVSVTRAMKYRGNFEETDARRLLTKKLFGVNQSSKNCQEKWDKQILHIWAENRSTANVLSKVYNQLTSEYHSNTFIIVTVVHECDSIFKNRK